MNEGFQKHSKNNGTSQVLFSSDWHNKSTLQFKFSFLQHSIPILLAFFSAKSPSSTIFRIPILVSVTENFLCEAYHFWQTL